MGGIVRTYSQLPATPTSDLKPGQKVMVSLPGVATIVRSCPHLITVRTESGELVHVHTDAYDVTPVAAEAVTP